MQAIILAAGLGRRLGPLTRQSTKFMVTVNGRPLAAYTLDALVAAGISRLVIVVGHGADEVRQYVGDAYRGVPVTYVDNTLYAHTNNIYSLLLAADELAVDDSLVVESDVLFDPSIVADCVAAQTPEIAVVARFESWMDGTVALLDPAGDIARLVPRTEFNAADRQHYFKTVNIYRFSAPFIRAHLAPHLRAYVVEHGTTAYYEEVLKMLVAMKHVRIAALDVGARRWYEIDDAQDLDIAETLFAADEERPRRFAGRFGGYWRFPGITDFAYLVNPFFPPDALIDELAADLRPLATAYPSGQSVQRFLAGRLFDCAAESLVVGNGASELIAAVLADVRGPVALVRPTFEEYPRLIPSELRVEMKGPGPDFSYSTGDLLALCRSRRPSALILIRPDNPTGHALQPADLDPFIDDLRALGVRLILDESFVDFLDGSLDHTLLRDDILARHPNLVVIRSLGKSFGVPGLRLGVLAAADPEVRRAVADRQAIWNINSLAEAFLQRVPRYRKEYAAACRQVVAERERLYPELAGLDWLRPLPSAANFVLCALADGISAQSVVRHALATGQLLLKDCSGKPGLGDGQFIRCAVRDARDTARLLDTLRSFRPSAPRRGMPEPASMAALPTR